MEKYELTDQDIESLARCAGMEFESMTESERREFAARVRQNAAELEAGADTGEDLEP